MKKFLFRAGRIFWSWGFLKFVLIVPTLVVLLYVEEDWRGARAWAATKAKWEGKGETFDLNRFTPPLISDGENLGAVPMFKPTAVVNDGKSWLDWQALRDAMAVEFPHGDLPYGGQWTKGERLDLPAVRQEVAAAYAKKFAKSVAPASTLEQFDALFPFIGDLHTESMRRPLFQLLEDYSVQPPADRALGGVTLQIRLARILALHAMLALDERKPDKALADFALTCKLAKGVWRDPTLVAGLVGLGVMAIGDGVIYQGLLDHAWSGAQLREIEALQGRFDYLAEYQFGMRTTAAEAIENMDYFQHSNRFKIFELLAGTCGQGDLNGTTVIHWILPMSAGWWDQNRVLMADYILGAVRFVDPKTQRAFPAQLEDQQRQDKASRERWDAGFPWRVWFSVMAGPLRSSVEKFAYVQACSDQLRIVRALERYWLVHGHYPSSLDELAPDYIAELPRDILKGEPYRYRLNADGTFVLYCVGWSGVDHGGTMMLTKETSSFDSWQGDWVWPMVKK